MIILCQFYPYYPQNTSHHNLSLTFSSRLSAWPSSLQCGSTATTAVPNPSPRMWSRATRTLSSPSASSSTPAPSRSTDTGWRRARRRTEQNFSRTLPKPSCCRSLRRPTSRLSTSGDEQVRTHLPRAHNGGGSYVDLYTLLHCIKEMNWNHTSTRWGLV